MKVLVLGASGATGSQVVQQLINNNIPVKAVIRAGNNKLNGFSQNGLLEIITGNISEMDFNKNTELVNDCTAVISCLGHNINFKGIFGKPGMLVRDSIKNICKAIEKNNKSKIRLILMSTTAVMNPNVKESYTIKDKFILFVISLLLPPQKDNRAAASYLSDFIGNNHPVIEWIAVRPDTLINDENVSGYDVLESPDRSPVFNPGKTSRINAAHFMSQLTLNEELWDKWKFKMPVIYNK